MTNYIAIILSALLKAGYDHKNWREEYAKFSGYYDSHPWAFFSDMMSIQFSEEQKLFIEEKIRHFKFPGCLLIEDKNGKIS